MVVNGVDFGRIVAGIGWPGAGNQHPGAVVIVGEKKYPPIGSTDYEYQVLEIREAPDTMALLDACAEVCPEYKAEPIVARTEWDPFWPTEGRWSEDREKRGLRRIFIQHAVYSKSDGNIRYHIENLKRLFQRRSEHEKPRLCGSTKEIDAKLKTLFGNVIPKDGVEEFIDLHHPAVAALGYAAAYLVEYPPQEEDDAFSDYDGDTICETTGY